MKNAWFRIYEYTEAVFNETTGKQTLPASFGADKSEPLHVYSTDSYHPDPRVRIAHGRSIGQTGVARTACGKEVNPRMIYVEDHNENERCIDCEAAMAKSEETHQEAQDALYRERIATLKARLTELGVETPEVETPEVVAPEAVDEVLHETIPDMLGELDEEPL